MDSFEINKMEENALGKNQLGRHLTTIQHHTLLFPFTPPITMTEKVISEVMEAESGKVKKRKGKKEKKEKKEKEAIVTTEKQEDQNNQDQQQGGQNIKMNKTIDHALRFALLSQSPSPTPAQTELFSKYCDKPHIPFSTVFSLSSFLKTINKTTPLSTLSPNPPPMFLHQLLEGAEVMLDSPKPPPPDPVIEAKLAELRARMANEEYERMVKNVTQTKKDRWEKDTRELNSFFSQLSIGLNIIVSMATTLTAGYWIGKMYVAPGKPIIGIAIGFVFMIIVLMAEVWLFIFRAERLNDDLKRQKREKAKAKGIAVTGLPPVELGGSMGLGLPPRLEKVKEEGVLSLEEKKKQ